MLMSFAEVSSMYWKTTLTGLLVTIAVSIPSFAADHPGKALFVKVKCNTCHSV